MDKIKLGYSRQLTEEAANFLNTPLNSVNSHIVELLGESQNATEVHAYDHLDCVFYEIAKNKEETITEGKYEVRLSLREVSENVAIRGVFVDENAQPLGFEFNKQFTETNGIVHSDNFKFTKSINKNKVFLVLTALYTAGETRQAVTYTVPIAVNDDKFNLSLHHPTKRKTVGQLEKDRHYGNPEIPQGGENFPNDNEHILIAMLREPTDTKDVDYVCGFGRVNGNRTYLGLPGQATLECKDGGKYVGCKSAYCYLYEINNNGGAAVQWTFRTDRGKDNEIISITGESNEVSYVSPKDKSLTDGKWKDNGQPIIYNYLDWWTQTAFHYEMKFEFEFEVSTASGKNQTLTYEVVITSRKDARFSKSPTADFQTVFNNGEVLPLKLMYGCLEENTQVLLAHRLLMPIRAIKIGESVATPDGGSAKVQNCWQGREYELLEIRFDGASVRLTANHPVQTPNGFVKAGSLKAGDEVSVFANEQNAIQKVKSVEKVEQMFKVCNLDTEGHKPFIISGGIIVGTNYTQNRM
ncbi:MAG: hypothetical protein LBD23_18750 [Oscillospiraceae bacterium]|nr:hypothetical protein [Oscillospiraceae bacterium]